MAFEITEEAVVLMRNLAQRIPNTVEELRQANTDIISCYESVRETVGPHTRQIESIVHALERLLKKYSEDINGVSKGLTQFANRSQIILDKHNFKSNYAVGYTPTVSSGSNNQSSFAPVRGQRIRQRVVETQVDNRK